MCFLEVRILATPFSEVRKQNKNSQSPNKVSSSPKSANLEPWSVYLQYLYIFSSKLVRSIVLKTGTGDQSDPPIKPESVKPRLVRSQ